MYQFLKKENTTCVNGVFILIVFISHLRTYMQLQPQLEWAMASLSQLMVAMFLFYSGFGVMESIQNKGMDYVKRIPTHRVLHVLALYIPAVLLYALVDLILGIPFTTGQFFLSLIAWLNLGNSNWYIFVILCLYLVTWLGWLLASLITKKWSEKETYRDVFGLVFTVVLSVGLILVLKPVSPDYYYNTISAYLFGLFFSQNKYAILRLCGFGESGKPERTKGVVTYVIVTVLMIAITVVLRHVWRLNWNYIVFLIMTVFFCMGVVLISYLIPFPDYVFRWFGERLFEVYILMRIPMMILLRVPGWEEGGLWYALGCLVITVVLAWVYHAIVHAISRAVCRNRNA
ncbi:MAG: hypothetical protein VZQ83_00360 [Eubacterium sp.]|nr:hypothetical protein [Eubacterium sp.]